MENEPAGDAAPLATASTGTGRESRKPRLLLTLKPSGVSSDGDSGAAAGWGAYPASEAVIRDIGMWTDGS